MAPQVMADFAKVGLEAPLELDAVPAAIDAPIARIRRAPNNEAAWNFLYGILEHAIAHGAEGAAPAAATTAASIADLADSYIASAPLRAFLVRAYTILLEPDADRLAAASQLAANLATSLDTLRAKYWNFRIAQIDEQIAALPSAA